MHYTLSSLVLIPIFGRAIASPIALSLPLRAPSNASPSIDPAFVGFALEESSLYYTVGTPNAPVPFVINAIRAITEKTNVAPIFRIGGTSLDYATYVPGQSEAIIEPPSSVVQNGLLPHNITIGPSYFTSFKTLPNAKYILDIPFAHGNLTNALLFTEAAYKAIGAENIVALELGNEPNNYANVGRPANYSTADYISEWTSWTDAISSRLGLPANDKIWLGLSLAVGPTTQHYPAPVPTSPWPVPKIFPQGLINQAGKIKEVSQHYYQTHSTPTSSLQDDLMNHTAVVGGSLFLQAALQYLNSQSPPIPYVVGELGNALSNQTDDDGLMSVLGSALWHVDFALYNMVIGVARINYQSRYVESFSLFNQAYQSVPAQIRASFYGQIFAAEFRGTASTVRVTNIDLQSSYYSAYGAYDNNKLARIALTNLELWEGGNAADRPGRIFNLTLDASAKSVEVKKLTSPDGGIGSPDTISWGGTQWTAASNGLPVQVLNNSESLPVQNGKVSVDVLASQAVIVFINY